jgi:hypothetical protein
MGKGLPHVHFVVVKSAHLYDSSIFLLLRPSCHSEASEASPKNIGRAEESDAASAFAWRRPSNHCAAQPMPFAC